MWSVRAGYTQKGFLGMIAYFTTGPWISSGQFLNWSGEGTFKVSGVLKKYYNGLIKGSKVG